MNNSRYRLAHKIEKQANDKFIQRLEKKDKEAVLLERQIEELKADYRTPPVHVSERKERMYPIISRFDRFVIAFLKFIGVLVSNFFRVVFSRSNK